MEVSYQSIGSDDEAFGHYLDQVLELDQLLIDPAWSMAAWSGVTSRDDYVLSVALDQNISDQKERKKMLGFALFRKEVNFNDDKGEHPLLHLLKVAVRRDFRRLGLAKGLLFNVISNKNEVPDRCYLEVKDTNHEAFHFYESIGFTTIHHDRKYYSCGSGAYKMLLGV